MTAIGLLYQCWYLVIKKSQYSITLENLKHNPIVVAFNTTCSDALVVVSGVPNLLHSSFHPTLEMVEDRFFSICSFFIVICQPL